LRERRKGFIEELESIEEKISSLKNVSERAMAPQTNEEIARIKKRIEEANYEMEQINEREELIGWDQTPFPKLQESQLNIKPFDDLWSLVMK
jgi:predicted  nucleic acid-binding Zn-ribbon protein